MKAKTQKQGYAASDPRVAKILKSLRAARKEAVASARLHKVPLVYLKNGKLVREIP